MGNYIHELPAWPTFTWDNDKIIQPLANVRYKQGRFQGKLEILNAQPNSLGMYRGSWTASPAAETILPHRWLDRGPGGALTQNYHESLTKELLLQTHAALFPALPSGEYQMRIGAWRDDAGGAMQLISTIMDKEHIHYQAPAAARIDHEVTVFLEWFNSGSAIDPVLKAAIAHLWFATLYPFDDGNGRMAAAITDRQLARAEQNPNRVYDLFAQIAADQHAYYQVLEQTQKGNLDITAWLLWFMERLDRAITLAEENIPTLIQKTVPYESHQHIALSERQRKMLTKLTDELEGHLTSTKWAELAHCSPDTALRDIHDLMDKGVLEKEEGGGRSTRYRMKG